MEALRPLATFTARPSAPSRSSAGRRARDVAHVYEVAPLGAVLVDHRRPPVQQARREDRERAGATVIAQVPGDALDLRGEVGGPLRVPVHLRDEAVERADAVAGSQQLVAEV
jgi:hypothetical protein